LLANDFLITASNVREYIVNIDPDFFSKIIRFNAELFYLRIDKAAIIKEMLINKNSKDLKELLLIAQEISNRLEMYIFTEDIPFYKKGNYKSKVLSALKKIENVEPI